MLSTTFPGPSSRTTPEDERLAEFRNTTNFRSVTRNDPSIVDILGTSVHSVIYHYDEVAEGWEKQKQEGPMFVVQRDKSPEYALYMLNRQAVKNIMMPLVPGEMKLTVVDASTLQVARRGEKQRRGIWFSEGPEAVERFRQTILRICGEPSKRPLSMRGPPKSTSTSPATSTPMPTSGGNDGLSRLFAGLVTSSIPSPGPGPATPPPPLTSPTANVNASKNVPTMPPPAPTSRLSPPPVPSPPTRPGLGQLDRLSHPDQSRHPPGQTVDDLLMSILGVQSTSIKLPTMNLLPATSQISSADLANPTQGPNDIPAQNPQSQTQPQPQPQPLAKPSSRDGDATFAQATADNSPVNHLNASVNAATLQDCQQAQQFQRPLQPQQPRPPHPSTPNHNHTHAPYQTQPPTNHVFHLPPAGPAKMPMPVQGPKTVPTSMRDAVLDGLESATWSGKMGHPGTVDEVGKRRFVQDLLQLIRTDPGFVDQVWWGYLGRSGHAPG